jgi:hypothetical protein
MKGPHFTSGRTNETGNEKRKAQMGEDIQLPDPDHTGEQFRFDSALEQISDPGSGQNTSATDNRRPLSPCTRETDIDNVANQEQAGKNPIPNQGTDMPVTGNEGICYVN